MVIRQNNSLIANGSYKSIVTKEYLEYKETKTVPTTTYTLEQGDCSKILLFTASAPITVTVPAGFRLNSRFEGKQIGAQILFIVSGTTIVKSASDLQKTKGQYSTFYLDNISLGTYLLYGNLQLAPPTP